MAIKLPVYISIGTVAEILDWSHYKARRWLRSADALVQRGDRWVTTPALLSKAFPEVYDEILSQAEDREDG